jgi:hypothetical protein
MKESKTPNNAKKKKGAKSKDLKNQRKATNFKMPYLLC